MKIKKLESLIKKSKSVAIVEDGGAFWLGNEQAMFPTYFEHMDFNTLMTMFDLDEEKRESITEVASALIARADTSDECVGEKLLNKIPMRLTWGKPLLGLNESMSAKEIFFIDERLLEPVRDVKDGVELYLRRDRIGQPYIAIKSGMLLIGLIEPERIDEMMLQQLKMLYDLSSDAFKKQPDAPEDPQERLYE